MAHEINSGSERREVIGFRETYEGKTADGSAFIVTVSSGTDVNLNAPLSERKPVLISCKIENDAGKLLDLIKIIESDSGYVCINDNKRSESAFDLLPEAIKAVLVH